MRLASTRAEPQRRRSSVAAEIRWVVALVGGAAFGGLLLGATVIACGPPPIGWQGAGRLQTLPSPQPEASTPSEDTGAADDTGTGTEDTSSADTGFDAGEDANDAGSDAPDDSGTPGTDADDAANADAAG